MLGCYDTCEVSDFKDEFPVLFFMLNLDSTGLLSLSLSVKDWDLEGLAGFCFLIPTMVKAPDYFIYTRDGFQVFLSLKVRSCFS